MLKRLERTGVVAGTDNPHAGTGAYSVQLGPFADAAGPTSVSIGKGATTGSGTFAGAVAIGDTADASGQSGIAVGFGSDASGMQALSAGVGSAAAGVRSIAVGWDASAPYNTSAAFGPGAATTAADQIMLGQSYHTVVVPGTLSTPSARRFKQNIVPAPDLRGIFPELVEYEYIDAAGRRRLGFIADDLVGTDAERFVVFDDDGLPSGIAYLDMVVAQVAQLSKQNAELHARLTELENKD